MITMLAGHNAFIILQRIPYYLFYEVSNYEHMFNFAMCFISVHIHDLPIN